MADDKRPDTPSGTPPGEIGGPYSRYVLGVLVLVYVLNFLDRQILSILNDDIKAALHLTDAQMGFLYGTAFAVFYALFGLPLGRLADVWDRRRLISAGLAVWSAMTSLSGLARGYTQLAVTRIGVGVGESSATPAAFSLLSDYFPRHQRATVLAVYSSGIYIGAGLGLGIGGTIVQAWNHAFAGAAPPLGLAGWQVAFLAVGLPGLLVSIWVASLREPVRGQADGIYTAPEPHPFRIFFRELRAVLPPLTLLHLALERAGWRGILWNLGAAAALGLAAWGLVSLLGSPLQWYALAIGIYGSVSWGQALRMRDRPSYHLIFRGPTVRYTAIAFGLLAFTGYGFGYWSTPFFMRFHGLSPGQAGLILGGMAAAGGFIGVNLGGILADRWRRRSVYGRLWVALLTAALPVPLAIWMLTTDSTTVALALTFPLLILTSMWIGPGASTVQDLVLPRMRGTASAAYILMLTFIGLALGPYTIGYLSVATGSLRTALYLGLVANGLSFLFTALAMRHLHRDEQSVLQRARQAGEPHDDA